MKSKKTFNCLHCREKHICDPRNHGRQRYCAKPECRKASKAASQRRWTAKPENGNYFRGAENRERVREWRKANPGYWRKKRAEGKDALQETCLMQAIVEEQVASVSIPGALQDICLGQPALLVGLISIMTGNALQEDIAVSVRSFLTRGEDILRNVRRGPPNPNHENQTHPVPASTAACAVSI